MFWGAGDVLVAAGDSVLRFVRLDSRVLGDFRMDPELSTPRPSEWDEDEIVRESFALDDDTWTAAFHPGVAIAPSGRESELDDHLAWSVAGRFGWPLRWGMPPVVADLDAALPILNDLTEHSRQE